MYDQPLIGVVAISPRAYNIWLREHQKPEYDYKLIQKVDQLRGRIFVDIQYAPGWYELDSAQDIKAAATHLLLRNKDNDT